MTMKMKMIDLYAFLGIIKNDDGWIWVFFRMMEDEYDIWIFGKLWKWNMMDELNFYG